jgi:hypothetical protein
VNSVALDRETVLRCRYEAARRNSYAFLHGHRTGTNHEAGLSGAIADEAGCIGEAAVAAYVGLPTNFGNPYDRNAPDVGPIEVRTRSLGSKYHDLRIYPTDGDRSTFIVAASILALGTHAEVRLWGWLPTGSAYALGTDSTFEPHPSKGKARWVPTTALYPMPMLVKELQGGYKWHSN